MMDNTRKTTKELLALFEEHLDRVGVAIDNRKDKAIRGVKA